MYISLEWWVVIATAGTAIGTISAVVVAIFGITLKKPKLSIEFQETKNDKGVYWDTFSMLIDEKDLDTGEVNEEIFDYRELHVFVRNKGKRVAKNCQLKWLITELKEDGAKFPVETSLPVSIIYEGRVLKDMQTRYFPNPMGEEIFTNIASEAREAFKLIYYLDQDKRCYTYRHIGFDIEKSKRYEVVLTAYADDASPVTRTFEFSWDGTQEGLANSLNPV